ncbi:MAG: hypothetical protein U0S76_08080 [Pseudoxanthomonas sp.]|nr:hypothetical protein [Pseudoxanthomonas sp.]
MFGLLVSSAMALAGMQAAPRDDLARIDQVNQLAVRHGWMTACHHHPADELYESFANQSPGSNARMVAAHPYAACLIEMSHEREAIIFLTEVLEEAAPEPFIPATHATGLRAILLTDLGLAHMRLGQGEAARRWFGEALQLHFDADNASRLAMLMQMEADVRSVGGDPDLALSLIRQGRNLLARAVLESRSGSAEQGRYLLQSAVLEATAARIDSGTSLSVAQSQAEKAIVILEALVEVDPTEINRALLMDAYANMASLLALQGKRDQALHHVGQARATAPSQRLHHVLDAMLSPIEGRSIAEGAEFEPGGRVALEEHRVVPLR